MNDYDHRIYGGLVHLPAPLILLSIVKVNSF